MKVIAGAECETLAFGQFYGEYEWQHDAGRFSLASIVPDDIWMRGAKHSHSDTHMIFVLDGAYALSSDTRQQVLPPRSLIFVPAGTTHCNHPHTRTTRILTISIAEAQVHEAQQCVRLPEKESEFLRGDMSSLAARVETEGWRWDCASPLTVAGLCLELLAAMAVRAGVKERKPPRWLRTVRELLHDRCSEQIRLAEVSQAAGVHPVHLCRTFRRFFHGTPGDYLRECRIEKAASLLRSGRLPLARVAIDCGFSDQSQMSKAFRRRFGSTPGQFRCDASRRV